MLFRRILLRLFRRRRLEQDMEMELAFHREMTKEHSNPIGLGNVVSIQEEVRDLWRFNLVEDFWHDSAYALRSLSRTPGFAAVAILSLAMGIGANTAIFTLIYRTMLESLPVRDPSHLIEVLSDRGNGPLGVSFSYQALQTFRQQVQACSSIIGFANASFHALIAGFPADRLATQLVTGDYFSALGVTTVRGRPIVADDDRTGDGSAVAIISHSLWQDRFGGKPDVVGKTVVLENVPFTVIGVAPAGFSGLEVGREIDIWVPLEAERRIRRPSYTSSTGYKWLQIIGRLKSGVPLEQAEAELRVLFSKTVMENEIAELLADPGFDAVANADAPKRMRSWSVLAKPARAGLSRTREQYSTSLLVLMAIVGVLLLIACTNVSSLLFASGLAREKEIALRLSLGSGRLRLIRQLLTESTVLVVAGGMLGVLIAFLLTKRLTTFLAPLVIDVSPNAATLGFTAAVSIFTVTLFGLIPALRSSRVDFVTRLKGGGSDVRGLSGLSWSGGLMVVEVALLLVLIFGAGLFVQTLRNLNSIDLGFNPAHVLVVTLDTFGSGRTQEQLTPLLTQLHERLETLPAVKAATLTRFAPITGGAGINLSFLVNRDSGHSRNLKPAVASGVWVNDIGPEYFKTLGTPMIAGREFTQQDATNAAGVVIVNQAFAEQYFGTVSPIGKTIVQRGVPMEIIGVVGNTKYASIRQSMEPTVFRNAFQQSGPPLQILIRTERSPESVAAAVRAEVRSVFGNVSLTETTLAGGIESSIVRERLVTILAALFGGLALMLAIIGLYGVVSTSVVRRTKEIGIRMALGFDQRSAMSMVLCEVFMLAGGGIILGLPLAILLTRSITNQLYGLSPDDPLTAVISVVALLLSALTAGLLPAWRASRVDPIVAIRVE